MTLCKHFCTEFISDITLWCHSEFQWGHEYEIQTEIALLKLQYKLIWPNFSFISIYGINNQRESQEHDPGWIIIVSSLGQGFSFAKITFCNLRVALWLPIRRLIITLILPCHRSTLTINMANYWQKVRLQNCYKQGSTTYGLKTWVLSYK